MKRVQMKILLLEDDVILQDIIGEFLEDAGYEVERFFDGEKALDAIGAKQYDMLLLDVNVPNIDGFEILAYLRDIGNTTPTIYITTHATIRTYIKNLRKMFHKAYFDNIKGEGYRFNIV